MNISKMVRKVWRFLIASSTYTSIEERNRALYNLSIKICKIDRVNVTGSFLDVGAGSGSVSKHFLSRFGDILLLDMSKTELKKARLALPSAFLICADARKIPFKDASFNQVNVFSLIEHINQPETLLREISRVLKLDGLLLLQFPNSRSLLELHTGIILPALVPRLIKDKILHDAFPRLYVNWNITAKAVSNMLGKLFVDIRLYRFSYPKEVVRKLLRPWFQVIRKLRFFDLFPMGYVILASNRSLCESKTTSHLSSKAKKVYGEGLPYASSNS